MNTSDSSFTAYISSLLLSANLLRRFRFNQLRYRENSPIQAAHALSHLQGARSFILKSVQQLSTTEFGENGLQPFLVLVSRQIQDDLYQCMHSLLTSSRIDDFSDEIQLLDKLMASWKRPLFLFESTEDRIRTLEEHLHSCDLLEEALKLKIATSH